MNDDAYLERLREEDNCKYWQYGGYNGDDYDDEEKPTPSPAEESGLTSCEFCGEEEEIILYITKDNLYYASCDCCGARTQKYKTQKEARNAWNTMDLEYCGDKCPEEENNQGEK